MSSANTIKIEVRSFSITSNLEKTKNRSITISGLVGIPTEPNSYSFKEKIKISINSLKNTVGKIDKFYGEVIDGEKEYSAIIYFDDEQFYEVSKLLPFLNEDNQLILFLTLSENLFEKELSNNNHLEIIDIEYLFRNSYFI